MDLLRLLLPFAVRARQSYQPAFDHVSPDRRRVLGTCRPRFRQFKEPMGLKEKEKATWLYLFTAPRTDRHQLMSPKDYEAFIALT